MWLMLVYHVNEVWETGGGMSMLESTGGLIIRWIEFIFSTRNKANVFTFLWGGRWSRNLCKYITYFETSRANRETSRELNKPGNGFSHQQNVCTFFHKRRQLARQLALAKHGQQISRRQYDYKTNSQGASKSPSHLSNVRSGGATYWNVVTSQTVELNGWARCEEVRENVGFEILFSVLLSLLWAQMSPTPRTASLERLSESARPHPHLNAYHVSTVSMTAGVLPRHRVWSFTARINALAFRCDWTLSTK